MPQELSERTIALVKATVPTLETHGLAITRRMYERMFQNEAIRDLFNQSHHRETGSQPRALAAAIVAYARNIAGLAAAPGGWTGWREFRVERNERESDVITSFTLRPADGGPVLRHRPGQYLT